MSQRHAIIEAKTGLVRNVIVWNGAEWLPPRGHYVIHDCDGQIGDYWHADSNTFYTVNGNRRYRDAAGKCGEAPLNEYEQEHIKPLLDKLFAPMRQELLQEDTDV